MHVNETDARAIPQESYESVTPLLAPAEVNVAEQIMITGWGSHECHRASRKCRQEAQQVMTALAGSASFERSFSSCSICGRERIVIGSNRRRGFSGSQNGGESGACKTRGNSF